MQNKSLSNKSKLRDILVPYKLAKKLVRKGFCEETFVCYFTDGAWLMDISPRSLTNFGSVPDYKLTIPAPTYEQVFNWFEDTFNMVSCIYGDDQQDVASTKEWYYLLIRGTRTTPEKPYKTKRAAMNAAIRKLIKIA